MDLFIGKDHKGNAAVRSIFRLVGRNEDALTYALGYLLALDDSFCEKVVRHLVRAIAKEGHPKGKRPAEFKGKHSIHLQELSDKTLGRRDIVIKAGGRELIVEAKIGGGQPSSTQVLKYALDDKGTPRPEVWGVVALTQTDMPNEQLAEIESGFSNNASGKGFAAIQWHKILELALNHRPTEGSEISRYLFGQFTQYMRGDYDMGYHDAEISIQDVNDDNVKVFKEGWMYVTAPRDKKAPLYFAPYFTGQGPASGISMMSRVLWVEQVKLSEMVDVAHVGDDNHLARWRKGIELIKQRPDYHKFAELDTRLLYLDEPIVLWEAPLTKSSVKAAHQKDATLKQIPQQIPKSFSLQFDELLKLKRLVEN